VGLVVSDRPLADLDYAYLTTTGRISGTPHRIEIWFAIEGQTVYLLAGDGTRSDWVRNLMISPTVVLEIGDRRRTTTARVVAPATDEDARARRLLVDKYTPRDPDDLTAWGRTALPIAIDWPS
jgi:deazaflavin-dependent oxidoreductase (nitroreductase family)